VIGTIQIYTASLIGFLFMFFFLPVEFNRREFLNIYHFLNILVFLGIFNIFFQVVEEGVEGGGLKEKGGGGEIRVWNNSRRSNNLKRGKPTNKQTMKQLASVFKKFCSQCLQLFLMEIVLKKKYFALSSSSKWSSWVFLGLISFHDVIVRDGR